MADSNIIIEKTTHFGVNADFKFEELETTNLKPAHGFKYTVSICEGFWKEGAVKNKSFSDVAVNLIGAHRFNSLNKGNWTYEFTTSSNVFAQIEHGNWLLVNKWHKQKCSPFKDSLTIDSVIKVLREFEALPVDYVNVDSLKNENAELKQKVQQLEAAIKVAKRAFKSL